MTKQLFIWLLGGLIASAASAVSGAEGDVERGANAFKQCVACHSLGPGRHLTGPSLNGVVGRAAGTADGFGRYSHALASSGLTWNRDTLDQWLADPEALVPGTSMRIRPVADSDVRQDLIAFLEAAKDGSAGEPSSGGGMMGGMMGGRMQDLKEVGPNQRVMGINYCGDAYRVTVGNGKTYTFWEYNLRFKTDSSGDGPKKGAPAIVGQGMRGDRAQVVFADPVEISTYIRKKCPR